MISSFRLICTTSWRISIISTSDVLGVSNSGDDPRILLLWTTFAAREPAALSEALGVMTIIQEAMWRG